MESDGEVYDYDNINIGVIEYDPSYNPKFTFIPYGNIPYYDQNAGDSPKQIMEEINRRVT